MHQHKNNNLRQPTLDVVPDEAEELDESVATQTDSVRYNGKSLLEKSSLPTPTSPGSSSSGLSLSNGFIGCSSVSAGGGGGGGGSSGGGGATSPSVSSTCSQAPACRLSLVSELPSSVVGGVNQNLRGKYDDIHVDSGHSNGDSELASEDEDYSGKSNSNHTGDVSNDARQHTLVSPVTRRIKILNNELGTNNNTLVSRDNLLKAGAILADLEKFEDEIDDNGAESDILSETSEDNNSDQDNNEDEKDKKKPYNDNMVPKTMSQVNNNTAPKIGGVAINESELVLKPRIVGCSGQQQQQPSHVSTNMMKQKAVINGAQTEAGQQVLSSLDESEYDDNDDEEYEDEEEEEEEEEENVEELEVS